MVRAPADQERPIGPPSHGRGARPEGLALKLLLSFALLAVLGTLAGAGTLSSLNDTTSNPGNSFVSGSVAISDNDAGTAMLGITAGRPASTTTGCVQVTYTGTLPAGVRLHATTTGTGLGPYLDLKITRGNFTSTPAAGSCTGFTADTTNYGLGAGIIYTGLLSGLGSTAATGVVDPYATVPAVWAAGDNHAYMFQVTVRNDDLGQGKNASTAFTWTAEST
jgi:predicted ribosomally synthesized peptide with SipW-like signal peptide